MWSKNLIILQPHYLKKANVNLIEYEESIHGTITKIKEEEAGKH